MMGDTLVVTVKVMDTTADTTVDMGTTTAQGQGADAFPDMAGTAVDKLSIGLCNSYWVGSVSIVGDGSGTSKTSHPVVSDAGTKDYPSSVTLHSHMYESASLIPPRGPSQVSGDVDLPSAHIDYQRSDATSSSDVQGYLDHCGTRLRNLTFTLLETTSQKAQDAWRGQVGVDLNPGKGTYTITIPGQDLNTQANATKKYAAFSKAPCATPPAPSSVTDIVRSSVTNWEIQGKLDPKNPYKLTGNTHRTDTGLGITNTIQESWSLTLKNPPKS